MKRAVIVAHYNKHGALRSDTLALLRVLSANFEKVSLVSTFLDKNQIPLIPDNVEVMIRENIGYDFYSYRLGLLSILNQSYDYVTIINTSFLCIDIDKFINNAMSVTHINSVFGISKSHMVGQHVQSYFYTIPSTVFNRHDVVSWFLNMTPISIRNDVIFKYEIGFSKFLIDRGIPLIALHESHHQCDPTQIEWQTILERAGIIKISLLKSNTYGLDLSHLYELAKDHIISDLFNQGLED